MNKFNGYAFKFTVTGRGDFPMDMLRYDSCHPATPADAAAITDNRDRREVTLYGYRPVRIGPTFERWESFGWKVVG